MLVGAFEPTQWGSGMSDIMKWVYKGHTLIIVDNAERWAEFLADKEVLDYRGSKKLGTAWYGGNFFNREHPIFDGLPVNCVFNWEYQCFATYNRHRVGVRCFNGETLVACVSDHKKEVYSALSVIPAGRGKIIITTLDIPACIKDVKAYTVPVDLDGMNESMNTFNTKSENRANVVGQQLLLNLIKEVIDHYEEEYYCHSIFVVMSILWGESTGETIFDLSGKGWHLWQDKKATWQTEDIYLTLEEARKSPVIVPTAGWDILTSAQAVPVQVPGTAEEYLQTQSGPEGDITGVTWWSRTMDIPVLKKGQKVFLNFGSIRSRAEIFINQRLVDYQIVDNVPFETDITPYIKSGEQVQLAVRITDAGGNHDWRDSRTIPWGDKMLPPGHGFGGITGKVGMKVCNAVYVADIYMQNTPQITTANAILTLQNEKGKTTKQDLRITVYEWQNKEKIVYSKEIKGVSLNKGMNELKIPVSAPDAKLWSVDDPNLYVCEVELSEGKNWVDKDSRRFGFRWFEASGIGEDAVFRLNGKRIMLRSAISWSFWPVNGIFPSEELAERQIRIAKELGLNMLNFHRFIGNTDVMNYADELGLLYFEEPGGFRLDVKQPFMNAVLHEKVIRMVKRDRSHPCLVIYNMMNESGNATPEKLELEIQAMKDMRVLDPSRLILRTSAWAKGDDIEDQAKIHIRPYDEKVYWSGWYDYHRAGGPAVWNEGLYKGPEDYYNDTKNKREIVFFGEEGALSSPPRLEKIKKIWKNIAIKDGMVESFYVGMMNLMNSWMLNS